MRLNVPFLDLAGVEIRRVRLQSLAADPTGLTAGDAGRFWYDTVGATAKVWNGANAERLTNLVESVQGTGPAKAVLANKVVTISVDPASGSGPGTLSVAQYNLLSGASATNSPSALVQRDAAGNFSAGTITANLTGTASNASALGNATLAQVRDFSQTTGTREASAISNFYPAVYAVRLDQLATPTAPVAMGLQRITSVADPISPQDVSTKNYVDAVATGLDTKGSVKAATTAALPSNTYANGSSGQNATLTGAANGALGAQDNYTLAVGDRLLVKNEATAAKNGIYVVTVLGTASSPYVLTRATDADTSAELTPGAFTFIENGQSMAGSGWVVNTPTSPIVLGSTGISWVQFSSGASYTQGSGISITGSVIAAVGVANRISVGASGIDIDSGYVGQTSITTLGTITTGVWNGSAIAVTRGGTGATTAASARANLAVPGKYAASVGAIAAGGSLTITHGLGNTDLQVTMIEQATMEIVGFDISNITTTQLTITAGVAIADGAYRIVVTG